MITKRKKFFEMLYNYLWAYILLIISQIVMYLYYPKMFEVYNILFTYLYLLFFEIFEFFAFIIKEIFTNYNQIFLVFGIILIMLAFYKVFIKVMVKGVKGGKK